VLVVGLGWLAWQMLRPREPMYQGKPLSYWMGGYDYPAYGGVTPSEADQAVRQLGTNAIPTLLRFIGAKDSALKLKVIELVQKPNFVHSHYALDSDRHRQAVQAFEILGDDAKGAVPALIKIYNLNISDDSQYAVAAALGWIGPSARLAIPSLLQGMNGTNFHVRLFSIRALGQIHAESAVIVPALKGQLKDREPTVQMFAIGALGDFGPDAKPAVPALIQLLSNHVINVREGATNALKQIDPEAAAKGGVNENQTVPYSAGGPAGRRVGCCCLAGVAPAGADVSGQAAELLAGRLR